MSLATEKARRAPLWLVLLLTAVAFGAGVYVAYAGALGCGENVRAGTAADDLCNVVGSDISQIAIAAAPALAILLAGLIRSGRTFFWTATFVLLADAVLFAVVAAVAT